MASTNTRYCSFDALKLRSPGAAKVVQLMIACNDMSLANQALADWKSEQPRRRKARAFGARLYFVRTQFSHLYEGLKIIEEIEKDAELMALVNRCDQQTQTSFAKLLTYLKGGVNHATLNNLAGKVRHNLTFHYAQSGELILRAITDLAQRGKISSVTRANTAPDWHFEIGDIVVDQVVCHHIWHISKTSNVSAEADKIADQIHEMFLSFMDFSGEFIWRYCEQ